MKIAFFKIVNNLFYIPFAHIHFFLICSFMFGCKFCCFFFFTYLHLIVPQLSHKVICFTARLKYLPGGTWKWKWIKLQKSRKKKWLELVLKFFYLMWNIVSLKCYKMGGKVIKNGTFLSPHYTKVSNVNALYFLSYNNTKKGSHAHLSSS